MGAEHNSRAARAPPRECKPPWVERASDPYHARDTAQHRVTPDMLGLTPRMLGIARKALGVTPITVGIGCSINPQRGLHFGVRC